MQQVAPGFDRFLYLTSHRKKPQAPLKKHTILSCWLSDRKLTKRCNHSHLLKKSSTNQIVSLVYYTALTAITASLCWEDFPLDCTD